MEEGLIPERAALGRDNLVTGILVGVILDISFAAILWAGIAAAQTVTGQSSWTGTLPTDGDYTVRVYMMRSASRKGYKASYTLKIEIPPAVSGVASAAAGDGPQLAGTVWQLVHFQSMDDKTLKPDDPAKYTIAFHTDGKANIRADCNRGQTTWKSEEQAQLEFGPLALTRAMCPPGRFTIVL